ncbi:thiamine diphosphokinase [Roseovarius nanhaiticus]|uniref:thiamine diphosphokinase n=1 Tax=Roseovarius nanhaiticus TaxID=573024 RepID=UPI002491807D|nr:thiamine diphosphokinase [Roseovarius nanhaiticus]
MIVHKSGPIALIGGAAMPKPVLERALTLSVGIVAADGGAGAVLAHGRMPDAVIGDFDSITDAQRAALPADVLHPIPEQDSTDFEKCLCRIDAPLVIGAGFSGARVDHQLAVCNVLVRFPARRCVLLSEDDVMFLAPPTFALDLPEGCRVSLFPMGAVEGRSEGLNWPIGGLTLTPDGQIGTSNFATGPVQISVTAPKLLVILPAEHLEQVAGMLMENPARWP